MACMFYFARCINIIFNSLLAQLVKYYDVAPTTRKIKFIHAIFITYYYFPGEHDAENVSPCIWGWLLVRTLY